MEDNDSNFTMELTKNDGKFQRYCHLVKKVTTNLQKYDPAYNETCYLNGALSDFNKRVYEECFACTDPRSDQDQPNIAVALHLIGNSHRSLFLSCLFYSFFFIL